MLKVYIFKLSSVLLGIIAGVLYLCKVSENIWITLLAIAGLLLFIDTKVNKENIYASNLKYMAEHKVTKK